MTLTAILIGHETLTRECGQMWLDRGHRVAAVVTRSADLTAWAWGQGLAVVAPGKGLAERLPQAELILSIANLDLIPAAVLGRASGAVNFHDGPLPRRAGLNAPVWALLDGDASHGITWHRIGAGVDDGPVLVVRTFPVATDDTALTLNAKCFAAALDSFAEVIGAVEAAHPGTPQDIIGRKVHRAADRPAAFGRLDFVQPAAVVARTVRALDHGSYPNPMCLPKIAMAGRVLTVSTAAVESGSGTPGQVLQASRSGLVVACAEGAVRLTGLSDATGPVCASTLTANSVDVLTGAEAARLTAISAQIAQDERRLRRIVHDRHPATLSDLRDAAPQIMRLPWTLDLAGCVAAATRLAGPLAYVAMGTGAADGYVADWAPFFHDPREPVGSVPVTLMAADLPQRDPAVILPQIAIAADDRHLPGTALTLTPAALFVDVARVPEAQALHARLWSFATRAVGQPPAALSLLTPDERDAALYRGNQTARDYDRALTIPAAFAAQVARTPQATALVFEGTELTYAQLDAAANRVAARLVALGVGPDVLVGLHVRRSAQLVIGALGILKAGGAYVPMDPAYPADRTALYLQDSACPVLVTERALVTALPPHGAQVVDLDGLDGGTADVGPRATPGAMAYMIYTSGSTGRPKGVMVNHQNVINFFAGMDDRLGSDPGTWMAVTSLSFDISVLELFWTLTRGFKVVITSDDNRALVSNGPRVGGMDFSLYYWGNDDGQGSDKYRLLLDGARFADAHGFAAVWTPERHFHAFGGPYPNPAVTGAAVAAVTSRIGVRAGSCVAPLHHPARIAEEWAVIDNMTNGRAGIAFASGWQPDDFVLRPENTPPANKAALTASIDQVRRLWRGEAVDFPTATGTFAVTTQPRPVRPDLPVWVTTAGNPDTWREAGRMGANVLTHLLGQTVDEVGAKIAVYHQALRDAGHDPAEHHVTLMLHTYLAATRDAAREVARAPMKDYLRAAAGLIKQYAWAFPAFKKPAGAGSAMDIDLGSLAADEMDAILDFAFQRYFADSGLFGTVDDALARVAEVKAVGVTEIACLIDYGIAPDVVLDGLRPLAAVVAAANADVAPDDFSIAGQLQRHRVTHLQCTPSMARMIVTNDDSRAALGGLTTVMLGGEALTGSLVDTLRAATPARIINMYGPTETTIWSSTEAVGTTEAIVNLGTPIANTQFYVLDDAQEPVPPGTAGELWIGGDGVAGGYWQRPDLTAERFVANPFVQTPDARIYRTGDLVRMRPDGRLDFLGRADNQVKLRGYRIELGEIEATLEAVGGVTQAVVLAREDVPGDLRLVAYTTGPAAEDALREAVSQLPAHMRPAAYVRLSAFPLTPNRKVDRKALPPHAVPSQAEAPSVTGAPAGTGTGAAAQIAAVWQRLLGVPRVQPSDNFFALGGHSLLAVQAHREIKAALGNVALSITDIFRFPTLDALARHLGDAATPAPAVHDRADLRTDAMARRRELRAARGR
jgi:natural product biosynthesis luciferase-like monooxygenase protein